MKSLQRPASKKAGFALLLVSTVLTVGALSEAAWAMCDQNSSACCDKRPCRPEEDDEGGPAEINDTGGSGSTTPTGSGSGGPVITPGGGGNLPVGGGGGSGSATPNNPSVGPISGAAFALDCAGGGSDCSACSSPDSTVFGCGSTVPFANVQLQSLAGGSDMIDSAKENSDTAATLLSAADPAGGGSKNGGNSGGGGGGGAFKSSALTTSASPGGANGAGGGTGSGGSGTDGSFSAGGGANASGGASGRGDGGGGSAEGGHAVVDLGGAKGDANSLAASAGSVDGLGTGRPGFDPDDSSTWTDEEKKARLAAALAMDPDKYFAMIRRNRSIFEQLSERYDKLEIRGAFRTTGPVPASIATGVKKLK